jgi:hypothetical protein
MPRKSLKESDMKPPIAGQNDLEKKNIPIADLIEKHRGNEKLRKILKSIQENYGTDTVCVEETSDSYILLSGHHKELTSGRTAGAVQVALNKETGAVKQIWEEAPMRTPKKPIKTTQRQKKGSK